MLYLIIYIIFPYYSINCGTTLNSTGSRAQKALSVFTVVKFENDVCQSSTNGRNGTCYTSSECTSLGGSSSGSCASSFGVCCVFEKSCGGQSEQNNTYFTSANRVLGSSCSLTICKNSNDVCQLRLDFEAFALNNPVTSTNNIITASSGTTVVGQVAVGQCQTDFFTVSVPGGKAPPVICGTNTGYHMYIPASDQCNVLSSYFGSASTATSSAFTIKVTQVDCNSKTRAPENCLQYFTASSGTIETFNYQSGAGTHLASQDYCACIRADRSACTLCMQAQATTQLGLGGAISAGTINAEVDTVCGYGAGILHSAIAADTDGTNFFQSWTDFVEFPGGQCDVTAAAAHQYQSVDRYCGTAFQCVGSLLKAANSYSTINTRTVCTSSKPFQLCLNTDATESYATATSALAEISNAYNAGSFGYRGYQMTYWQKSTCLMRN